MKSLTLVGCLLIGFSSLGAADTVSGSLVFNKKAAFTGVIYAKENAKGPDNAAIDQKNKVFDQKVVVVGKGGKVNFKNSDSFQHNIFANDVNTQVQFDVGLMEPGQASSIDVNWKDNTLTRIGCKIHPRMRSYIANIPSNVYQILEFEKGKKEYPIKLDAGDQHDTFILSIPKYEPLEIKLAKGESKTIDVMKKGKKKAQLTLTRS